MKVFIGSTVYDLADVRAELAELLRELGVEVLASEESVSDLQEAPSANAIETSLVHVDVADLVIFVLDKRYGPRLGDVGCDDVSATHLEYKRAVARQKPNHFFVRDRLQADFAIWKKNRRRGEVALQWVQREEDFGLLELMEEHTRLSGKREASNCFRTFRTSQDLKATVRELVGRRVMPSMLLQAINEHRFPLIEVRIETELQEKISQAQTKVNFKNVGGAPAFDVHAYWEDAADEVGDATILAPNSSMQFNHLFSTARIGKTRRHVRLTYSNPIGLVVTERYELTCDVRASGEIRVGIDQTEQTYREGATAVLRIEPRREEGLLRSA